MKGISNTTAKRICYVSDLSPSKVPTLCKIPGDILFSSVAGGPPHVHSPDRQSTHNSALQPTEIKRDKHLPVSLFNSLLDPNIELPTISVCEVDAVLSNLTPNLKTTGDDACTPKTVDCHSSSFNSISVNDNDFQVQSLNAKSKMFDNDSLMLNTCGCISGCNCKHFVNSESTICCENEIAGFIECNTAFKKNTNQPFNPCSVPPAACPYNGFDKTPTCIYSTASYTSNKCDGLGSCSNGESLEQKLPHTVSLQSMFDMLPLFPSCRNVEELGVLTPNMTHQVPLSINNIEKKNPKMAYSQSKSRIAANLSYTLPKTIPWNKFRDRSPIGSLDLATNNSLKVPPANSVMLEAKYRQANLTVRKANQAKLLSQTSRKPQFSPIYDGSQISNNKRNTAFCLPTENATGHKSTFQGSHAQALKSQDYLSGSGVDDRFKYVCPHPRCGRRYQAEIGLLRHLVKYHGEPIELPRRIRPVANPGLLRRPASEERITTSKELHSDQTKLTSSIEICISQKNTNRNKSLNFTPVIHSSNSNSSNSEQSRNDMMNINIVSTKTNDNNNSDSNNNSNNNNKDGLVNSICDRSISSRPLDNNGRRLHVIIPLKRNGNSHNPQYLNLFTSFGNASSNVNQIKILEKQPRLRSASGSLIDTHDDDVLSHNVDDTNLTFDKTAHLNQSDEYATNQDVINPTCSTTTNNIGIDHDEITCHAHTDTNLSQSVIRGSDHLCNDHHRYRRRTLSTGSEPELSRPDEQISMTEERCPTCGYKDSSDVEKSKEREWISGVHALSCSKTDVVQCPIDSCDYTSSGRADLSAHLTKTHFPEVEHQLVRLIFACPLKDCQTVCADEVAFQTHFNGHLFGQLPGDLTELFNSSTILNENSIKPDHMMTVPVTKSCKSIENPTSVSGIVKNEIIQNTEEIDNYDGDHHSIQGTKQNGNPQINLVCSQINTPVVNDFSNTTTTTFLTDSDKSLGMLSPNCHSQSKLQTEHGIVSSPTVVTSPPRLLTPIIQYMQEHSPKTQESCENFEAQNPVTFKLDCNSKSIAEKNNEINNTGGQTDLADTRNLLSALDLIPDDILVELLKEDRASLWGDTTGSYSTTLSAPHQTDTASLVNDDSPAPNTAKNLYNNSDLCDTSSACNSFEWMNFDLTHSPLNQNLDHDDDDDDDNDLLVNDSNYDLPTHMIRQTCLSTVINSNEPCSRYHETSLQHHNNLRCFTCPHRAISDLTAALILPDLEHRLKASMNASCVSKSSIPSDCTTCSSTASLQTSTTNSDSFRATRRSCCAGKRRRNASESPPLFSTHQRVSLEQSHNINGNSILNNYISTSDEFSQNGAYNKWSVNELHNQKLLNQTHHNSGLVVSNTSIYTDQSHNNKSYPITNASSSPPAGVTPYPAFGVCVGQPEQQKQTVTNRTEAPNLTIRKINLEQIESLKSHDVHNNNNNNDHKLHLTAPNYEFNKKRPKKHQKLYTNSINFQSCYYSPYSIDKLIIHRPVLPRRHSMASYNFLRSGYCSYSHLPH